MKTKIYTLMYIVLGYMPINTFAQYYKDLSSDIEQVPSSLSSVANIQSAFNNGRTKENQQLGTSLPQLVFPVNWSSLDIQQKATWILNNERADRGLKPFSGADNNVISVAQAYAEYLLKNNKFGHDADGSSPEGRLKKNPTIGACNEGIYAYENLYVTVSSSNSDIPHELELGIYSWLYADGSSAWGHRRCLLQTSFKDNGGITNEEGLIGIGVASGGPYKGNFSQLWNHAEIVVFNVIDPCASWIYIPTGIKDISPTNKCNIYYDGNSIRINTLLAGNKVNVEVYNILGENIYQQYSCSQVDLVLEHSFKPGVYIVRIVSENNAYSRKIIVK